MIKELREASVLRKDINGMRGRPQKVLGKCVLGEGTVSSGTVEWKLS